MDCLVSANNLPLLNADADNDDHMNYDVVLNQEILEKTSRKAMAEGNACPERTFRVGISNFSKLTQVFYSPPYQIRNLPWKIMVIPQTNEDSGVKSLGFYVQCHEESDLLTWSCTARVEYRILSQKDENNGVYRNTHQVFTNETNSWGFLYFTPWKFILDPEEGFIKNDIVILEVFIQADAPHGVNWDSKKHSGFVGIKTTGALCNWSYVDSFLQILFFTNKLRKAIYQLPTEIDDSSLSYALGLQRIFYHLQFSDEPVGTEKLFKTLGCDNLDAFMKYDAQELDRILLNNMQSKMKGTCVEDIIPQLFEGNMMSFVRCKNVNYTSERLEPFYDIQLNIKGNQNILESFKEYCAVETLEGANQYHTEEYGLQDAEKGIRFITLPKVLRLCLSRFEYDPTADRNTKIYDRFEFFEKLDLGKFLQSPEAGPAVYTLHAVLTHFADCEKGHYAVFINPKGNGKWYKFDEDVVSPCSKQDAIDYNFGESYNDIPVVVRSNACMLVYIQESALGDVLQPVTDADVPEELAGRLKEEKRQETILRQEQAEAHLYMKVQVLTSDHFCAHQDADLYDHEKVSYRTFKVKKESNLQQLTELIAKQMNYHVNMIRIWRIVRRKNMTWRPMALDVEDDFSESIFDIAGKRSPWTIFLETIEPDSGIDYLPEFDKENDVLLFFKFYDPKSKRITYCGHKYICINTESSIHRDLVPVLNERVGFAKDTELVLFQELKPNVVKKMNPHLPLKKVLEEFVNTHIIVFQKADIRAADYQFPTVTEYFRYLFYRVEVIFCDKLDPKDPGFTLELSFEMSYDQMVDAVARRLNVDPCLLLFFKCDNQGGGPGSTINSTFKDSLKLMFVPIFLKNEKYKLLKKIYYQLLHVKINQLANKRQIKCKWLTSELQEEELILSPNKNGHVADLLEEARKQVELSPNTSGVLRLLKIISNKVIAVQGEDTSLDDLGNTDAITLRIEEVPREELVIADDELLIPIAHFHKEVFATFGIPFLLKMKDKEPFVQLVERIRKKLNVPVKEYKKFKFAIVIVGRRKYIEDTDALMNLTDFLPKNNQSVVQPRTWLGLDHINEPPKSSKFNYYFKKPILYY